MSNILNSKQVFMLILSDKFIIIMLLFLIMVTMLSYRKVIFKSGFAIKSLWIKLCIVLGISIGIIYFSVQGNGYSYNDGELKFYSLWSATTITKDQIKDIKLIDSDSLYPVLRYNGISLRDFSLGLFSLNNGERAQVFIFYPQQYALVIHLKNEDIYYLNDEYSLELYKVISKSE